MKIVYRPAAVEDIRKTSRYISEELKNPSAAESFTAKVLHGISLLKENPQMGQSLKSKFDDINTNYHYIIINKHLVFYEISSDTIEIVRVLDGRTDYLSHLI